MRRSNPLGPLLAVFAALIVAPAAADIVGGQVTGGSSGGTFQLIAAPPTVGPDAFQSPDLLAFNERQDVELLAPLPLRPGVVAGPGSVLSSHYVAFDPDSPSTIEGLVDFDEPVVGILSGPQLAGTNALFGLPGTTYVTPQGIGPDPNDEIRVVGQQLRRVLIEFAANSPGDHFRVLTGTVVPEPAAWMLVVLGSLTAATRGR